MLQEARRLATGGQPPAVVVARLDRFGRSVLERARCAEELRGLGIAIHSACEGGLLPQLVCDLLAAVAEDEVLRLRQRLAETRKFVAESGWDFSARPAWGYIRRIASHLERAQGAPHSVLDVDPECAPYVREAFDRAERGDSVSSIAAWVQRLSNDTRGRRKMSYFNVRMLLRRPVYIGRHIRGSVDILERPRMRWPPLITDGQWERVQARLAARAPKLRPERKYLLAGLIRCPKCGARMGGNRNQHELARARRWKTQARYVCIGRTSGEGGPSLTCYESAVMPQVDAWVIQCVSELLERPAQTSAAKTLPARRGPNRDTEVTLGRDHETSPTVSDSVRKRLARAALRLVDGQIGSATYRRTRDRTLAQAGVADYRSSGVHHRVAHHQIETGKSEPNALAEAWRDAAESDDVPGLRRVLLQLVVQVVPKRVARGEYQARIQWTKSAQEVFGAPIEPT